MKDITALADLIEASPPAVGRALAPHLELAERRARDADAAYLASLPEIAVSRCPLTGTDVRWAVDVRGISGPWWRAERPLRRPRPEHPTLFAITGALRLGPAIEPTEFLVKPGPGAPYVLPRLLDDAAAVAAVSSLAIGAHTGYVIAYFAPHDAARRPANDWGTDTYELPSAAGTAWGSADEEERDFALRPWIERGRLWWIAPGASTLAPGAATLAPRDTLEGCPYLGLDGPRAPQRIQYGRSW